MKLPPIPSWADDPQQVTMRSVTNKDDYIPTGRYPAVIVETAEKHTPQGRKYYAITFMLIECEYAGIKIEDQLHCKDPNPEISDNEYGRLSGICHAVNVLKIGSSAAELHGIPLEIDIITIGRTSLIQWYRKRTPKVTVSTTTIVKFN
ncbi:DUF669 domain-containing protein [Mesorhizobium kowhaii]|uniref:Uncharacterized protein n=1 Tax=Mesorhizobium kowhaii TaxID=1300272 RepID=A0A2W7C1F9_9HYPH|nr:DUF669 domain-containing protein [Mesorhizobium kowhaii]PZV36892.1 hypothetical protein B5V02_19515 [Mesorhizobium kowhaii]